MWMFLVYGASIGLVVAGVQAGYMPEGLAGALYLLWALAGLGLIVYSVAHKQAD